MMRLTDVVRHILVINIIMYVGTMALDIRYILAAFYPTSPNFQPYQIVTHMFMHADFFHLLFNMYALYIFGPLVESRWGPKRFLIYYFLTGFGALGLHFLSIFVEINFLQTIPPGYLNNIPMLGASGAVFGVLVACGMIYPNLRVQLLFPPIPMKIKHLAMLLAGIELFLAFQSSSDGIAHFAHLGGALTGFIMTLIWNGRGSGSDFDRWD
ncbi:MAG: rhomboid family intramembrane serine protease [Saprospiraceae bacterium]|nr:rhomboid family intramembrane serine protease [Saprospiraceae bacterium]